MGLDHKGAGKGLEMGEGETAGSKGLFDEGGCVCLSNPIVAFGLTRGAGSDAHTHRHTSPKRMHKDASAKTPAPRHMHPFTHLPPSRRADTRAVPMELLLHDLTQAVAAVRVLGRVLLHHRHLFASERGASNTGVATRGRVRVLAKDTGQPVAPDSSA